MKRLLWLPMVLVLLLCGCGADSTEKVPLKTEGGKTLAVSVLKAGKADAIIVRGETGCVLIDCGEKDDGDKVLEVLKQNGIKKVDTLIITHFDKDHVGGVPEVLEGIETERILVPDYEGNNGAYDKYLKTMKELNKKAEKVTESIAFSLDDAMFQVYPPQKKEYEEEDNDFSLVTRVTHGNNRFLFAGDAEEERLSELPIQMIMDCDFLKVPHHGEYDNGTKPFLIKVKPSYAVITCSGKNAPDEKVLKLLSIMKCKTFLTADGTVTAISDGHKITVSQ